MPESPETGFDGVPEKETPSGERKLTEQERLEQEKRDHLQCCEDCGFVAYAELTGKVPEEEVEEIYRRWGYLLKGAVGRGALYYGSLNFQPETPVRNPQEYIQAFKDFIEQQKQRAEEAEAATPEFIEEVTRRYGYYHYHSSVDGKEYPVTAENWRYHIFAGKKENYEAWVEEACATLEGFGKAAMEAGDAIVAKEALDYSGYLQKFPELIKVLDEKTAKIKKAEQERLEQERRYHLQCCEDCGFVAYAELTGKVPEEEVEEIYRRWGYLLKGAVGRGALYYGSLNFQPETPVRNPQEYIQAFKDFIEQQKQRAEEAEAATPEFIEEVTRRYGYYHYHSSVDGKEYPVTAENWRYHIFAGKKENYEAWVEEACATLEGFGKAASKASDLETYNLVQEVLTGLE